VIRLSSSAAHTALLTDIAYSDSSPELVLITVVFILLGLLLVAVFVIGFIWTFLRTIVEMRSQPAPGSTLVGTIAVAAVFVGLIYLIFFAPVSGQV
jgi:hypothetical protein